MKRFPGRAIPTLALVFSGVFLPAAVIGQSIHIANVSMSPLGATSRSYSSFSAVASHFDVVAADDVGNAGDLEKVLSGMDEGWEAAVSRGGFFGFLYSDRVQLVKDLGTYPGKREFARTPYGAQFRLAGTRFALNVVICHIDANRDQKARAAEIAKLGAVYGYYETLTGNHGITLLLAGGLGGEREQASRLLVSREGLMALKAERAGAAAFLDDGERMFASASLRSRIEEAGIGGSIPHAAYVVLRTGK